MANETKLLSQVYPTWPVVGLTNGGSIRCTQGHWDMQQQRAEHGATEVQLTSTAARCMELAAGATAHPSSACSDHGRLILSPWRRASIAPGVVHYGDVLSVSPFGNSLYVKRMDASGLLAALENGLRCTPEAWSLVQSSQLGACPRHAPQAGFGHWSCGKGVCRASLAATMKGPPWRPGRRPAEVHGLLGVIGSP